jgi:hypothetical protein
VVKLSLDAMYEDSEMQAVGLTGMAPDVESHLLNEKAEPCLPFYDESSKTPFGDSYALNTQSAFKALSDFCFVQIADDEAPRKPLAENRAVLLHTLMSWSS